MNVRTGDTVVFMTSDLWFPGGVVHSGTALTSGSGAVMVRCTKRRFGFLWNVHRTLPVLRWEIEEVIPMQKQRDAEVDELRKMAGISNE